MHGGSAVSVWRAVLTLAVAGGLCAVPLRADDEKEERRKRVERAARVGDYPPRPWGEAFTYEAEAYTVRSNTSEEVASYIGQLMDFAQKNYREVFGYEEPIPQLGVFAYRTYEEYVRIGSAPPGSSGFYRHQGDTSTIHVAYIDRWGKTKPTEILLHEGTHQFVHMAVSFPVPEAYRGRFRNTTRLDTVPLWLNEGMATYMEVSYYDGEDLVVGEINRDRLMYLRSLLRDDEHPSMPELFACDSPEVFNLPHYAASWGYVYWFLHDKSRKVQRQKRQVLKAYIEACKRGFMENPEKDFGRLFMQGDGPFWPRWQKHIRTRALEAFVELTVKKADNFPKWEAQWKEWILDLNPSDSYGGLRD
jgi:hypothetical protein